MAHKAANLKDNEESMEFAALLTESLRGQTKFEGCVVNGTIVAVDP